MLANSFLSIAVIKIRERQIMSEQIKEHQEEEMENEIPNDTAPVTDAVVDTPVVSKSKFRKKIIAIVGVVTVVVIAIVMAFLGESKFERVKDRCVEIAGEVRGDDDLFVVDTRPSIYEKGGSLELAWPDSTIENKALEAIRYANIELGLYSQMLETTALMGRQLEENSKYIVSWIYHPNTGLQVTYSKK